LGNCENFINLSTATTKNVIRRWLKTQASAIGRIKVQNLGEEEVVYLIAALPLDVELLWDARGG